MNLTLAELLQECAATPVFLLLLLPAGFALAWTLDLGGFRSRSRTEQMLWSVSLSAPSGLVLANVAGRLLSQPSLLALYLLIDLIGLVLALKRPGLWKRPAPAEKTTQIVRVAIVLAAAYLMLAALPIQWHGHLYEPLFSSDWEIRLPLIRAALRDGVPPHNPFFTYRGQSPPMRYYYYWYELCAQPARLLGTSARSILVASSVYAMLVMVSTLFLCLKYMVSSQVPLRRRCLWLLGLCLVLGLDVIPSLFGLFLWRARLQPEIEWWLQDRSPGLLSTMLFAPHHIVGIACGQLGLLALTLLARDHKPFAIRRSLRYGTLVALCFAALAGTSSFVMLFFAAACTLFFFDQIRRGDRRVPVALAIAAILSLAVTVPYLRELAAKTVVSHDNGAGRHALRLRVRGDSQGQRQLFVTLKKLHLPYPTGPIRFVPRLGVVLLHAISEFGFFLFVIPLQFHRDFQRDVPMPLGARALWILFFSVSFFFFFVTSSPIQSVNDLGIQAGLVLRVVYLLWAAQMVPEYLLLRHHTSVSPRQRWLFRLAAVCLVLGVSTTLWQALLERTYLALLDHGIVSAAIPFPAGRGQAVYYNDMQQAQSAVAHQLPVDAVVQGNPTSRYGIVYRLYQQRRQAAGDVSCEGSFGGNPDLCKSFLPGILGLFGVHERPAGGIHPPAPDPSARTLTAFNTVCLQDGLAAVIASRVDPAWYDANSWVWQGPVLYANPLVRVIRCPAG